MKAKWTNGPTGLELLVFEELYDRYRGNVHKMGGALMLSTTEFEVGSKRDAGIGTRLMMGGIALAKAYGINLSGAHAVAPRTLHISRKIFGQENLDLRDINDAPLDCSVDEALAVLEAEQSLPGGALGVVIYADLDHVDTSSWLLPDEVNQPEDSMLQRR